MLMTNLILTRVVVPLLHFTSKQTKFYRYSTLGALHPTEEPIHIKTSKGLTISNTGSTSSHRGTYTHQSKQRFIDIQHCEHFIPQRNLYTSKQAKVYQYSTLEALHPREEPIHIKTSKGLTIFNAGSTSSHRGTYTHQNKQRFNNIQHWEHFIPPTEEPIHIKTSKGLSISNTGSTSSHRQRNLYTSKQAKVYRYPTLGALHPTDRGTCTHQNKQRFIDMQRWEHFIPPTKEPIHIKASKGLSIFNAGSTSSHRGTYTHQNKQRFNDIQHWEHFIPPTEEPIHIKTSKGLSISNTGSTSSHRQRNLYTSKQAKVYRYATLGALHPTDKGAYTHQSKQRFINI